MPVVADLGVDVEVVEQHELARQGVGVGRRILAEEAEARIAVSRRQVAEDLVVGAVLLDDVEDVRDRRGVADARGNRRRPRRRGRRRPVRRESGVSRRTVFVSASSAGRSGVLRIESVPVSMAPMYCDWSPSAPGWGPRGIRIDVSPCPRARRIRWPSGVNCTRRRIPARRNEAVRPGSPRAARRRRPRRRCCRRWRRERSAVGRKREGVGRRARWRAGREGDRDLLGRGSRREIDGPDRVRVRARDEETFPVRRQDHRVGMLSHGKSAPGLECRRVEEQHLRASPERDEERRSIRGNEAGIGLRRQIHPLRDFAG